MGVFDGFMGPVGGAVVGGALSLIGAQDQNSAAAQAAQDNRNFQENMSNTAHQREVADLKAAGLNPMLSANAGASTPSGAVAPVQNTMSQLAGNAKDLGDSLKFSGQQREQMNQETRRAGTDADKSMHDYLTSKAQSARAALDLQVRAKQQPYLMKLAPANAILPTAGSAAGAASKAMDLIP